MAVTIGKKPKAAAKKKALTFTIDCSKPVDDKIMEISSFEKFLEQKIKVRGGPRREGSSTDGCAAVAAVAPPSGTGVMGGGMAHVVPTNSTKRVWCSLLEALVHPTAWSDPSAALPACLPASAAVAPG